MAFYFLDSSALVKRYIIEIGAGWIQALTTPGSGNVCAVVSIAQVEVVCALYKRFRAGHLTSAQVKHLEARFLQEYLHNFRRYSVTSPLLDRASRLAAKYPLRAYDAVQLACAEDVHAHLKLHGHSPIIFLSADANLNAAASEGLLVDDPNLHP